MKLAALWSNQMNCEWNSEIQVVWMGFSCTKK